MACPQVKARPGHKFVWQYAEYGKENWRNFSQENSDLVQDAYGRGLIATYITVGSERYRIDLLDLTQSRVTGIAHRRIRQTHVQMAPCGGSRDQENRGHDTHGWAKPADLSQVTIRDVRVGDSAYFIEELPWYLKERKPALASIYFGRLSVGARLLQVPYSRGLSMLIQEDTDLVLDAALEALTKARFLGTVDLVCYEPGFGTELKAAKRQREEAQALRPSDSRADRVLSTLAAGQHEAPERQADADSRPRGREASVPVPGGSVRRPTTPDGHSRAMRRSPSRYNAGRYHQDFASASVMTSEEELTWLRQMVHPHLKKHELTDGMVLSQTLYVTTSGAGLAASVSSLADKVADKLLQDTYWGTCELRVSGRGVPPEAIVAAISLGLFKAPVKRSVRFKVELSGDFDSKALKDAWDQAKAPASPLPLPEGAGACASFDPPFDWVMKDMSPDSRLKRLATAVFSCAFGFGGSDVGVDEFERVNAMDCSTLGSTPGCPKRSIRYHDVGTCVDAALEAKGQGKSVAVVNAAAAYRPGGGFFSGGRHALEEAMCVQSTLIHSLLAAARVANYNNGPHWDGKYPHIPIDGALLSRNVTFFRQGTAQGYKPLDPPVKIDAVISVAMPNRNHTVRGSPVEFEFTEGAEYERRVRKKLEAVVHAADKARVQVLVIPDVGCGVFNNRPETVGKILGRVLADYGGSVQEVILTGKREFYSAALDAGGFLSGAQAPPQGTLVSEV